MGAILIVIALTLSANRCPPSPPPTTPPPAPTIVAPYANVGSFSTNPWKFNVYPIAWQSSQRGTPRTFTHGWRDDVQISNSYGFSIQVDSLVSSGTSLVLKDQNGTEYQLIQPAVTNTTTTCPSTEHPANSPQCYPNPGDAAYRTPASIPPGAYSTAIAVTCDGRIPRLSDSRINRNPPCGPNNAQGLSLRVTIAPDLTKVPLDTPYTYKLLARNAAGNSQEVPFAVTLLSPSRAAGYPVGYLYVQTGSGGSGSGGSGSTGGCTQNSYSWDMVCTAGGVQTNFGSVGFAGCTRADAYATLQQVYASEISQGCRYVPN